MKRVAIGSDYTVNVAKAVSRDDERLELTSLFIRNLVAWLDIKEELLKSRGRNERD